MSRLLAAEFLKLRKRWMPRIIFIVMLAILVLVFWATSSRSEVLQNLYLPRAWPAGLNLTASFAPFLWPILGGAWSGNEFSWGTVRMVLSRRPDRAQFTLAQIMVLVFAVLLAIIAAFIVTTVAGALIALANGHSVFQSSVFTGHYVGVILKNFGATWYGLAFYVILGYAFGSIFRSAAVGIGLGIGFTVAELIVRGIFYGVGGSWETIGQHFPWTYTEGLRTRLVQEGTTGTVFRGVGFQPGVVQCLIGIAVYIAILLAVTLFLIRRRDVTA